jgi:4-oxalocrotonate tautomerase
MPLLNVALTGQPDASRSAAIASTLTELTARLLGKDPPHTAISVSYVGHDHWFIEGKPMSDVKAESFWLRVMISQGTNTKTEIAAYIDAVFAAMSDLLGGAREESYIVVDEVPGASYGFGGKTQEHRYIAGRLKTPR